MLGMSVIANEADITIVDNMETQLPLLEIDSTLIRQVVVNLIRNSIQSMPKGGRIFIRTGLQRTTAASRVILEVGDTGVGIPKNIQERIFEAYFTTRENEGGVGLGLAIAHQALTAHQAQIEVQSQVGMGTTFKISFRIPEK